MTRAPRFALLLVFVFIAALSGPAASAESQPSTRPGLLRERLAGRLRQGQRSANIAALTPRAWAVHGTERTALLHVPKPQPDGAPMPLIFVFHGHGGSSRQAAISFHLHTLWPEALIVYPQSLPSKGMTDPEGKKAGWETQRNSDHARDLDFVDAMLESLRKDYRIDEKAIFATGHSNGGSMTYLLWARRADTFTAFAPSASIAGFMFPELQPKPALLLAGETDTIVPYAWQTANLAKLKTLFHADTPATTTRPFHGATEYSPPTPTPPATAPTARLLTLIHPGGHQLAPTAPETIIAFFKQLAASLPAP